MKVLPDGDRQSERRNILLPVTKTKNTAILPLQPQQEAFTDRWQHLSVQVQRINQIANEL